MRGAARMGFRQAFFAFPGQPVELATTIKSACERARARVTDVGITPWPQMPVFGASIADEVRRNLDDADVVIADVTAPNYNVYYEIGYAIGSGKSIAPVVNVAYANATKELQLDGFFDTIGYATYENTEQLIELFRSLPTTKLVDLYGKPLNTTQPLYLLDSVRKTDFRNAVVSSIKDAKVFYRSFDPIESPRFSTINAITEVTASSGVVVPLLASSIDDAPRHNLRAAFLAGLSQGLRRKTLILQFGATQPGAPADYRDLVATFTKEADVISAVTEFCLSALQATQEPKLNRHIARSKLQSLSLGASAAENEFRILENYFVETSEYVRTLRGDVNVVSGRKGSGKTAIFFMVRDTVRVRRNTQVTDLKPESHQLSLFRQELLQLVNIGVFDHTLAAFWYFVFLTEMLFTIKRDYQYRSKFEMRALTALHQIEVALHEFGILDTGDFTARINNLSKFILTEVNSAKAQGGTLSAEKLTNIVFRGGINRVKQLIIEHTDPKTQLLLLFDNIDKGWPTNGVEEFDIRMIRLMVESLDKIRRDLDAQERNFISVVFLRNDIYELLVEQTPDRGKAGQIRIDWNDRAKLRMVIYKRLQASTGKDRASFSSLWLDYFTPQVEGRDSFDYCVDHSLMRPRFLITIVENAISNAINRGNTKVSESDLIDAVRQHSNYLISEFGYEIRDASGLSADILFALIGVEKRVTKEEVIERFKAAGIHADSVEEAFRLMLWYGVLGVVKGGDAERFIYDYDYSLKRLLAETKVGTTDPVYVLNSALHVALSE